MSDVLQKQMLCISIQEKDNPERRHLRFESEPYYRRRTRRIYTECYPDKFGINDISENGFLNNDLFLEDIGFALIVRLLVHNDMEDREGWNLAQIIYPHHRSDNPVLRIDEEQYEHKSHRKFCARLPLASLDRSKEISNEELKRAIACTVLKHLPLVGFDIEEPEMA